MSDDTDVRKQARKQAGKGAGAEVRLQARKAASAAGREWSQLSREERRPFMVEARRAGRRLERGAELRKSVIEAAEQEGQKWSELSKEQRQGLRQKVVAAKKAERQAREGQGN